MTDSRRVGNAPGNRLRANLTAAAAILALLLAIVVAVHPLGRLSPGFPLVLALLLGVRYAMLRQRQKRLQMLDEVPKRPLGLSEEDAEEQETQDRPRRESSSS